MSDGEITFKFITIHSGGEKSAKDEKVIHHKKARKNSAKFDREKYEEKELIWTLKKYAGKRADDGIDWQYQSSTDKLNEVFTAKRIAELINSEVDFDFEYIPEDNDYLVLGFEYTHPALKNKVRPFISYYISFLFKNKKWTINQGFDHINNDYTAYKSGKIEYVVK